MHYVSSASCLARAQVQGPWQSSLRALCALEAVVQQGASTSCGEIAVHFQSNPTAIQDATRSTQASLRIRANAVLQLLGVGAGSGAATAIRKPAVETSLLDFGEGPAATAPSTAQDVIDLLGGGEPAPAAITAGATPAGNGLFEGLDTPIADSAAGMFGGLSLGGGDLLGEVAPAPVANQGPAPLASLSNLLPPSPAGGAAPQLGMQQPGMMQQPPGMMSQQQMMMMQQQPGTTSQQQMMMMMMMQQQQEMVGGFVPGGRSLHQQHSYATTTTALHRNPAGSAAASTRCNDGDGAQWHAHDGAAHDDGTQRHARRRTSHDDGAKCSNDGRRCPRRRPHPARGLSHLSPHPNHHTKARRQV